MAAGLNGLADLLPSHVFEQALERAPDASATAVRVEDAVGLAIEPLAVLLRGDVPVIAERLESAGAVPEVVGRAEHVGYQERRALASGSPVT